MEILLATDGSDGSIAAAQLLWRLPLSDDDTIRLVACESFDTPEAQQKFLATTMAALQGSGAAIELAVVSGNPAHAILEAASAHEVDCIAIGAMGETGLLSYLLGSVAERVLRHAKVPVLLARPIRSELREVIAAVDQSEVSEAVARAAAWLPLPEQTELRLMTVIPPRESLVSVAPTVWSGLAGELNQALDSSLAGAEEHLRDLGRMLQHTRRSVAAEVVHGDAATAILAAADRNNADLIILGSHGEGGVDRWLLGSVSERVARHANCSVLVVH